MDHAALHVLRSARLGRLEALLVASGAAPSAVRGLDDAADLLGAAGGTVLYDADAVPVEDLGILARAQRGARLVAIRGAGGAPHRPDSFRPDEVLDWPIDVETLERLAAGDRAPAEPARARASDGASEPSRRAGPAPVSPAAAVAGPRADLGAIERILRGAAFGDGADDDEAAPDVVAPVRAHSGPPGARFADARPGAAARRGAAGGAVEDGPGPAGRNGAPRTAFLRTRIQPAVRPARPANDLPGVAPPPHGAGPAQASGGAPSDLDPPERAEGPLARAFQDDGPLLTDAELEAFFGDPPPAVSDPSVADPAGPEPAPTAPAHEAPSREVPSHGAPSHAAPRAATAEAARPTVGGPEATVEADAVGADSGEGDAPRDVTERAAATAAAGHRPPWLRAQVADLADIVQALDLRARASHAHAVIGDDLARLRQFTRTIGFVAAPPAGEEQDFDLASFVEEQLGEAAGVGPDAPRLLFRRVGSGAPRVRADKSLVALAFDALLQTALACAGSGDVVRVSVTAEGGAGRPGPPVTARVDFPRGPLAALAPADLLRPYALGQVLPVIGPNALAAAGGIAVGQGGDLVVEEVEGGRLTFLLDLPASA